MNMTGMRWIVGSVVVGLATSLATAAGPTTAPVKSAAVASAMTPASGAASTAKKPLRVLFIGNSYTFFNGGLGAIVQSMAAAIPGTRKFEFVEVTKGGQTLEGHWRDGKALAEIRKGNWDYVVLQEHSLRPVQDREKMWQYAKMFNAEIRKVGAKTVFYETWARKNRPEMQAILDSAYGGLAKEVSAMIAPAGLAWERVLRAKPEMTLHIADLSHPTPAGSYLNACVFYETFFGKSCEGLPRVVKNAAGKVLFELSEGEARTLQQAALETCGPRGKSAE